MRSLHTLITLVKPNAKMGSDQAFVEFPNKPQHSTVSWSPTVVRYPKSEVTQILKQRQKLTRNKI